MQLSGFWIPYFPAKYGLWDREISELLIYESHLIDQVVTCNLLRWLLLFIIVDRSCPEYQAWFRTTDPINAFHPENLTYLRTAIVLWPMETTPAIIHWFKLPCKSDQTRHCEEPVRETWQSSTPGVQFIYFWELLRIRVRYTNRKHNNTDHFCGDRRH